MKKMKSIKQKVESNNAIILKANKMNTNNVQN
jgi:hypothetical protein